MLTLSQRLGFLLGSLEAADAAPRALLCTRDVMHCIESRQQARQALHEVLRGWWQAQGWCHPAIGIQHRPQHVNFGRARGAIQRSASGEQSTPDSSRHHWPKMRLTRAGIDACGKQAARLRLHLALELVEHKLDAQQLAALVPFIVKQVSGHYWLVRVHGPLLAVSSVDATSSTTVAQWHALLRPPSQRTGLAVPVCALPAGCCGDAGSGSIHGGCCKRMRGPRGREWLQQQWRP